MNFLQSGLAMTLAPLVALPFLIHLLNRKLPVRFRFPDIERIRRSIAGRSRLARWRHLIMLLLRTLVLLLLLFAFLRPVIDRFGSRAAEASAKSSSGSRRVLLLADHSLSMEFVGGTRARASNRLPVEVAKIIASLESGDTLNAVAVGREPVPLLADFTTAHDEVRTALAALPTSNGRADFTKALALAASLLGGKDETGGEIFILSDFQRANWSDVSLDAFGESVRVFFVDVSDGDRERPNTALLSVAPSAGVVSAREAVRLEITAANFTPDPKTLPLEVLVDDTVATPGEIRLGAWSTGRATVTIAAPGAGIHGVEVRTPDDGLPADNRRWLRLEVREKEEVLVLGDETDAHAGARFVAAALDPWDGQGAGFAVRRAATDEVTAQQIGAASRIVLTGAGKLNGDLVARLAAFVEKGGGLLWFLDSAQDQQNLMALDAAARRPFVPFQLAGRLTTENFGGKPLKVARGDFESPLLRLFRGTGRQSLALLDIHSAQRALPTAEGSVILFFADGMPAMGTGDHGLGTVVLCNFSPAELAGNLARQRFFPAWMQDMVKTLRPVSPPDDSVETGGTLVAEVWARDLADSPLRAPDGSEIIANAMHEGERVTLSFPASQAGLYTQGRAGNLHWAGSVNVPASESDLRGIDPDELSRRSASGSGREGHFVSGARDYAELESGRSVFHWFILAAAAFVVLEMLLFRPFLKSAGHSAPPS